VTSRSRATTFRNLSLREIDQPNASLEASRSSLADEMDYRRVIEEVFLGCDHLTLVRKSNALVGFSAHNVLELHRGLVLYVAGTVVDPSVQDMGLMVHLSMRQVIRCMRRRPFGLFGAFRSQNPIVVGANYRRWGGWPRPDRDASPPARYRRIASQIVERMWPGAEFDPGTLVIRSAFPKDLVAEAPIADYHDESVNALCRSRLNLSNGDAFLALCRLTLPRLLVQPWINRRRRSRA
jgi:hypothetical protein